MATACASTALRRAPWDKLRGKEGTRTLGGLNSFFLPWLRLWSRAVVGHRHGGHVVSAFVLSSGVLFLSCIFPGEMLDRAL